jgi:hypothetical protein
MKLKSNIRISSNTSLEQFDPRNLLAHTPVFAITEDQVVRLLHPRKLLWISLEPTLWAETGRSRPLVYGKGAKKDHSTAKYIYRKENKQHQVENQSLSCNPFERQL